MICNGPWTIFAAVAAFGVLTSIGPDDFGLLAAAAFAALVLFAMFDRAKKRDPHDEIVRTIEQQMKDHRWAARAKRAAVGKAESNCL